MLLSVLFLLIFIERGYPQTLKYQGAIRFGSEVQLPVEHPGALAVTSQGTFYVTDPENDRILQVDKQGAVLQVRGKFGWAPEEFDNPADIVLAQNLDIYVADYYNQRLQHFDRNFNFIGTIALISSDKSVRYYPKSVDQSTDEQIYVLDAEQHQLLQLNKSGNYVRALATFSEIGSDLKNATRLRVNSSGDIWVLSSGDYDIYTFDQFGTFKYKLASPDLDNGVGVGFFRGGLAIITGKDRGLFEVRDRQISPIAANTVLPEGGAFVDAVAYRDILYVLSENPAQILMLRVENLTADE